MSPQRVAQEPQPHGPAAQPHQLPLWALALGALALVRALVAASPLTPFGIHSLAAYSEGANQLVHWAAWIVCGLFLVLTHSRQVRSGWLGLAMILLAGASSRVEFLSTQASTLTWALAFVPLGTLLPYALGRFLLEYPRPRPVRSARWLVLITRIAAIYGACRLLAIVVTEFAPFPLPRVIAFVGTRAQGSPWGAISLAIAVLILVLSFMTFDGLLPDDRRRHRRLLPAWMVITLNILLTLYQSTGPAGQFRPLPLGVERQTLGLLAIAMLLIPLYMTYQLLVGQRWIAHIALRRAVAGVLSYPMLAASTFGPPLVIALVAYREQDHTVAEVFSSQAVAWLALAAVSGVALTQRDRLMALFNRWFFQDHYDVSETLYELTSWIRQSRSIDELVAHITSAIDRVFRPYRVVVLVRDASATQFVPLFGTTDPLPASALLADILTAGRGVLDTPLAGGASPMRWLPQEERYWIVGCGAQVIVPLHASDGSLLGLMAISDRRTGRPYGDDDRRWLTAVAEAASLTIEGHSTAGDSAWEVGLVQRQSRALECPACSRIEAADAVSCGSCGHALVDAHVPLLLAGKFKFERRVGQGGMGVVYRAYDLALERPVAVKMLPEASPETSEHLRLEARAMATVTHRHLAVIYGLEAWRNQLLLVCEFMERGTLADRLVTGPMSDTDVLELGIALAEALDVLHTHGLLHRDLKPSNIGFDRTGVAKVLDFGLARLLSPEVPLQASGGTPLYMSPEGLRGAPPTAAVDLWALNVLLYEAMSGRHPFRGATIDETMHAIRVCLPPPITVPNASRERQAALANYFTAALSERPSDRPSTASAVGAALRRVLT